MWNLRLVEDRLSDIQFKRFSNVYKCYFHKLDRIYVQEDAYVQGLKNHKIDKWCNLFGYGVTFFV